MHDSKLMHNYTKKYFYKRIYIYICVCVCVCVCLYGYSLTFPLFDLGPKRRIAISHTNICVCVCVCAHTGVLMAYTYK